VQLALIASVRERRRGTGGDHRNITSNSLIR